MGISINFPKVSMLSVYLSLLKELLFSFNIKMWQKI